MGRQGYLSGFSWHNEYHSSSKKKKAANCIHLDEDRICRNKKSPYYLSKCFVASNCPLRVKEEIEEQPQKQTKSKNKTTTQKKKDKEVYWY